MAGHWVGEPYECNGRDCREDGGGYFWFQAFCCLWQRVDGAGNPVGDPVERTHSWVNTGEPCDPEPEGSGG